MTDLLTVVPELQLSAFSNIVPSLERSSVTATDLLTLDAVDIAKQAQVPARDVRRLASALLDAVHAHVEPDQDRANAGPGHSVPRTNGRLLAEGWTAVSTLDDGLDRALGGGFSLGHLCEITGESGAGKTQLLLTLLLSIQRPPPCGLSKSAIYISTEAALQTARLDQIANNHPRLSSLSPDERPSLSRVLSIQVPDIESQDHILRYQLPIAIKRHNIGLVVVDSITANFRAEFERRDVGRAGPETMARRSAHLMETAGILRDLARNHNMAVVVANQVADRFPSGSTSMPSLSQGQSFSQRSRDAGSGWESPAPEEDETDAQQVLTLDQQQRWFTGWGDTAASSSSVDGRMKTPSLGLVWTNQLTCRVALRRQRRAGERRLKVVFAPWARDAAGEQGVKFRIGEQGLWTDVKEEQK
ncbi:MAG: hypothetical protein Q9162_001335 [Coniocarpon cinnabarinum]